MVAQFFQYALRDSDISFYFIENISDIAKHHRTFTEFIGGCIGGPQEYRGKSMKEVHAHMKIPEEHFNTCVKYLGMACKDYHLSEELIGEIVKILAPLKDSIVEQPKQEDLERQNSSSKSIEYEIKAERWPKFRKSYEPITKRQRFIEKCQGNRD